MTWDVHFRFCGMLVLAGAVLVARSSTASGLTLQA